MSFGVRRILPLAAVFALASSAATPVNANLPSGSKAPLYAFTTTAGKKFDPAKLKGKVVLIDFWATWCIPCKKAIPHLQKIYSKLHSSGLEMISVSVGEGPEKPATWAKKNKITYNIGYSSESESEKIGGAYDFTGLPTLYILDKKGVVRFAPASGFHEGDEVEIEKTIKKLLAER
jgi:thiol-disulfide isomerase/thioredoxin